MISNNSFNLSSPSSFSLSVDSESRPLKIGISYFLLNSCDVPSKPGFAKLINEKYSKLIEQN